MQRRYHYLKSKGMHFIGCGVSGGEEGARYGPSLMPGGDVAAWYAHEWCSAVVSCQRHREHVARSVVVSPNAAEQLRATIGLCLRRPAMKEIFQSIAAKADGEPCCDWVGTGGAGHFVKMVHNGIEYGDMQRMRCHGNTDARMVLMKRCSSNLKDSIS